MGAFLKEQSLQRTDCESCQSSFDAAALNLVSGLANIMDAAVASVDKLAADIVTATSETTADEGVVIQEDSKEVIQKVLIVVCVTRN